MEPTETNSEQPTTQPVNEARPADPAPVTPISSTAVTEDATHALFRKINRVTALILVVSAIAFALISILAIWQVFGPGTGEIVWRSLSSLATIAFAALVINVATKLIEQHK